MGGGGWGWGGVGGGVGGGWGGVGGWGGWGGGGVWGGDLPVINSGMNVIEVFQTFLHFLYEGPIIDSVNFDCDYQIDLFLGGKLG